MSSNGMQRAACELAGKHQWKPSNEQWLKQQCLIPGRPCWNSILPTGESEVTFTAVTALTGEQ
jgi:hypothetical protein